MAATSGGPSELVTIGVPVFNESRHLRSALDAIVGQTYSPIEIIISDNASTDGSFEICTEYAHADDRITLVRQETNIGAISNWNFLAQQGSGRYFKWASANDLCAPTFVEKCVEVLSRDPRAVLCYSETDIIDEHGNFQERYDDPLTATQDDPVERFRSVCQTMALANLQSGVIRTDALRKTLLEGMYRSGDIDLLRELCLYGTFIRLDDVLFSRRLSPRSFSKGRFTQYNPGRDNRIWLDKWKSSFSMMRRVARSETALLQKASMLGFLLRQMIWNRNRLMAELGTVVRNLWRANA